MIKPPAKTDWGTRLGETVRLGTAGGQQGTVIDFGQQGMDSRGQSLTLLAGGETGDSH